MSGSRAPLQTAWRASGNLSRRPYFLSCGLPLNCLNEEVGGMARQGWSMSEMEIRRIAYLLSETDLVVAAIAERMDCSKSAIMSINRRFQIRDYVNHRKSETTWNFVETEKIQQIVIRKQSQSNPAA